MKREDLSKREIWEYLSPEFILKFKDVLKYLGVYSLVFLILMFSIKFALPFIIAYVIATLFNPVKVWLINMFSKVKFLKIKEGTVALFITLSLVFTGALIIISVAYQLYLQVINFIQYISSPATIELITETIYKISDFILSKLDLLDPSIVVKVNDYILQLTSNVGTILGALGKNILNFAISIPQLVIIVLITIISIFFFIKDYDSINSGIKSIFSEKAVSNISKIKVKIKSIFNSYIKAYSIIMGCIFILCYIAYTVADIKYAFLIALITAILDLLPLIGSGFIYSILIITSLVWGNYYAVIVLIIGYCITTIARALLEQNVVATFVGVHPLVIIIGLFIALSPLGIWAMLYFIGAFLMYNANK